MAILVTGGAGYIGSVTADLLSAQNQQVVVLDNLGRGHRGAVSPDTPFYQGDVGDNDLIRRITAEHQIEACIHFAAFAYVGESVEQPALYLRNNVSQGIQLLESLINAKVKRFVFSSTCATYGEPQQVPISETHPQQPTNPYGWSKFMMERALEVFDRAYGLKFVALRYFNAAGATAERGEHHDPETHIIPNTLRVALGALPHVSVFGNDYDTPDGTAIRDYIHVSDLASAHIAALEYLRANGESTAINLGNGRGYSVLEVIDCAQKVTGKKILINNEPRRPGDPSRLIADDRKAREILKWQPARNDLMRIIRSAWEWHLAHPSGYPAETESQAGS
jgi:UDP-glucose 4-epimerase